MQYKCFHNLYWLYNSVLFIYLFFTSLYTTFQKYVVGKILKSFSVMLT